MSTGGGTGQPNYFQCSQCRKAKGYEPSHEVAMRGRVHRVKFTGRAREYSNGRGGGRGACTQVQFVCDDCGHTGWSRHIQVIRAAQNLGIDTPGTPKR